MNPPPPAPELRKVLIVTLHFPPINAPDMQRTRMALPYLRACGWEPVILAVAPELIEGGVWEPMLESTYPADIRVIRVGGIPAKLTRWAGLGSLWWRCGRAIRVAGDRILAAERFDLVFISTTQFDAFSLGPRWKRRHGVPYVLDYQDPWVNDYYDKTGTKPPGGWLKFGFSQWEARRKEPAAVRGASGIIAVSGAYGKALGRAYPWFDPGTAKVIPFGAAEGDFDVARRQVPKKSLVPFGDGMVHLVYAGRCGPDMSTSLTIVFRAFKLFLTTRPAEAGRIRFHFIGTDYAPRPLGREWAMPVAVAEGVEQYVEEHCYRVPYFDALYYLTHADGLIAVGSNDPTYSASKIFPYFLARKPMLVIFNESSLVLAMAKELNCGVRYSFGGAKDIERVAADVAREWFLAGQMGATPAVDLDLFRPYSAQGMTLRMADSFNEALARHHASP
jgi:hypothetical protein